jgi:hypothetical protein
MNRKDRRAAKMKLPRPSLRELATAICIAAPECVRVRWGHDFAHSAEMAFAGREVFRRHQYGAELATCVLVLANEKATLCLGDRRAAYNLLARKSAGKIAPYEQWESETLFGGDRDGRHTILMARDGAVRALVDLAFGQVAFRTKGAILTPPAFVGLGTMEWHAITMGDLWFQYAPGPASESPRELDPKEWSRLIDDLFALTGIALGCRNDEAEFAAEMTRRSSAALR